MESSLQSIPARHAVATFVPASQTIKIINSSGAQVVELWAFALPPPEEKKGIGDGGKQPIPPVSSPPTTEKQTAKAKGKKSAASGDDLPNQEDAERATRHGLDHSENESGKKSTWSSYMPNPSSYIPHLALGKGKSDSGASQHASRVQEDETETQQQKNSRTWASYFPSGKAFSSYLPKGASDTVSRFAASHHRDPSKTYMQQLQDFSRTPVGAAGLKGLAVVTGSSYSGSLYAGYSAWSNYTAAQRMKMEVLSMKHTREALRRLQLHEGDQLVTNVRQPILTLLENHLADGGGHDMLLASCDPQQYACEIDDDESAGKDAEARERRSCAENLVLALRELNERAGLSGARAVGADVTINSVPAPLGLFRHTRCNGQGKISVDITYGGKGDFVRFKAARDVVVVMSACPMDDGIVRGGVAADAQFVVEEDEQESMTAALERTQVLVSRQKNPAPFKTPPRAERTIPATKPTTAGALTKPTEPAKDYAAASQPIRPNKKPIPPLVPPSRASIQGDRKDAESKMERKKSRKLASVAPKIAASAED